MDLARVVLRRTTLKVSYRGIRDWTSEVGAYPQPLNPRSGLTRPKFRFETVRDRYLTPPVKRVECHNQRRKHLTHYCRRCELLNYVPNLHFCECFVGIRHRCCLCSYNFHEFLLWTRRNPGDTVRNTYRKSQNVYLRYLEGH